MVPVFVFGPRPFEEKDVAELFAAGDEARQYFEPRMFPVSDTLVTSLGKSLRLKEYIIRVDRLRGDLTL